MPKYNLKPCVRPLPRYAYHSIPSLLYIHILHFIRNFVQRQRIFLSVKYPCIPFHSTYLLYGNHRSKLFFRKIFGTTASKFYPFVNICGYRCAIHIDRLDRIRHIKPSLVKIDAKSMRDSLASLVFNVNFSAIIRRLTRHRFFFPT